MSQVDPSRLRLTEVYRRKARHYGLARLSPVPGYPVWAQRRRAVRALGPVRGGLVVDVACGTGQNFPLLESVVGPGGRIVGIDLTDAMLVRARRRVAVHGWSNIRVVHADAQGFAFPTGVEAILSTYALTQMPRCGDVVAHGAAALVPGGRWVVLDLQLPASAPSWLVRLGAAMVRPHASIDPWLVRRPWDTVHTAVQESLTDVSWTELCLGTAFLACGLRAA